MPLDAEQIANLAQPFPQEAIHWRAQSVIERDGKHKAMALAYIDARDVMGRLDGMCGPENWQDRYEETPKGRIICTLSIRVGDEWVSKSDGAGETDVEGDKGALSDALKRAAVKWGIGRYLYSMPSPWVPCEVGQNKKFKKFSEDPWKHVRGAPVPPPAPANEGKPPAAIQKMLDEIEACETQPVLQRWWKDNNEKIPDAHYDRVLGAANKRREAIDEMDRAVA